MLIYFIRHGETDWNKNGRLQGRVDIPLNEEGKKAALLTREGLKEVVFDVAFSSPLKRAYETAEIILTGRNVPIIKDERLREVGFGAYEGVKRSEWDENIQNFFARTELYFPKGEGEHLEKVLEREADFLRELFGNDTYKDSTILVSTHGAALSGLLTVIKGNSIADFWAGGLHKNCGISIVEVKEGIPNILQEAILLYDENRMKEVQRCYVK